MKYTAQVWDPTTCTYTPKEIKGPRTLDEWRAHWRVYSFALRCFGAVDRAWLQQCANLFERLHSDYANLPGGGWWIIAVADVRMRSEHVEKLRRKAEQAYESNPNSGFDPARPWDWVFALAARDRDFWTAHVKDRAHQYMHHLKSKGDIIGPDAIAAAGEYGDGRADDKATRTNKPSRSKRRQTRAAGRLGKEGESEAARKRGRGFNHGGGWGSGGSGQQPCGPGGCGNNGSFLGNYTGKGRGTYSGQVLQVGQRRMVIVRTTDYMSANIAAVHGTGHTSTQSREGRAREKERTREKKRGGSDSLLSSVPVGTGNRTQVTNRWIPDIRTTVLRGCELNTAHLTGHTMPTGLKGRVAALGLAGRQFLSFHLAGARSGRDLGGDDGELSTATMVTIGPEAPHRTALYNFEKGNYRRVGKWGNTLVSADHYVESKPPRAATAPNDGETQRERRDRESRECIGGMRSPWRSVRRMPAARTVGARIKRTIEKYIDHHPECRPNPDPSWATRSSPLQARRVKCGSMNTSITSGSTTHKESSHDC